MFIKIAALSLAIAFSLFAVAGIVVQKTGLLIVDVQDRDGRVFLPIPMLLVNGALSFAPLNDKVSVPHEFQNHSDLLEAAASELSRCPDGPFLEVDSPDTKVLIEKRGQNMIVNVNSDSEKIYIQIPIRATGKTIAKLASFQHEH